MDQKIKKFLELSLEFSLSDSDIYENISQTIIYHNDGVYLSYDNSQSTPPPTPTNFERLKEKVSEKIAKAERWEEFKTLRNDLNQYYTAKQKLR